jgi:hypothetical protein
MLMDPAIKITASPKCLGDRKKPLLPFGDLEELDMGLEGETCGKNGVL